MEVKDMVVNKTLEHLKKLIGNLHVSLAEVTAKNELYTELLNAKDTRIAELEEQLKPETEEEQLNAETDK